MFARRAYHPFKDATPVTGLRAIELKFNPLLLEAPVKIFLIPFCDFFSEFAATSVMVGGIVQYELLHYTSTSRESSESIEKARNVESVDYFEVDAAA